MVDFTTRLKKCVSITGMTVSDMARFLRVPRATVNTWLLGRVPYGPKAKYAAERLALLEKSIKTRAATHYPIPDVLSWRDRVNYVQGMRDDAERHDRVSNMRAAG
jgi:hypothetical protein